MHADKVDTKSSCNICHVNARSGKTLACSLASCRKELRRWQRLHHTAQADLYDAAKCFGELIIACDEAGGSPPGAVLLKAVKMIESAAVAYTMAAAKVGKLPKADKED